MFSLLFQSYDVSPVRECIDFPTRQLGEPSGLKGTRLQTQQADGSELKKIIKESGQDSNVENFSVDTIFLAIGH